MLRNIYCKCGVIAFIKILYIICVFIANYRFITQILFWAMTLAQILLSMFYKEFSGKESANKNFGRRLHSPLPIT